MGRRGHHSFEQLSKMILDSADKLLMNEGFQKISTRKIANSIGYSVGTLYNIFHNLDDIYINLNGRTLDRIISLLNKALLDKSISPTKAISYAYIKFSQNEFNAWSLLFEYRFPENTVIPKWYNEKISSLYNIVFTTLSKVLEVNDEDKMKQYIAVLWSGIHGICILSNKGKLKRTGIKKTTLLVDNFIDNYLNGIKLTRI